MICIRCGRIGQRWFSVYSGNPDQDYGHAQFICTADKACTRRERRKARRMFGTP